MAMDLGSPSMGALQHLMSIKLTTTNYVLWKNQMEPLINYFELSSFIDLEAKVPKMMIKSEDDKESVINPSYNTWKKKDQLLKSWILSSLSSKVLPQTFRLSTSAEGRHMELQLRQGSPSSTSNFKASIGMTCWRHHICNK